ncbi:MAG TPA: DinB family protein [Cyclobacteriaceae bacterium]|jgi:uncharacterized damage-inducible protein DinB|nr:DinB family protein [Cyclobacteriaceae bacterium]
MERTKWFDRKFDFDFTQNIFPSIIDRLRGAPARLDEKLQNVSDDLANKKINAAWSIKENIGHLIDLEPLWMGRLDDILAGKTDLRAADLANTKTDEADHNRRKIKDLLKEFRAVRSATIKMIEPLTIEQIYMSALHPRLKTPMRTMDHFLFVAEHDDHHLVTIHTLIQTQLS